MPAHVRYLSMALQACEAVPCSGCSAAVSMQLSLLSQRMSFEMLILGALPSSLVSKISKCRRPSQF